MTEEEKAKELVDKFLFTSGMVLITKSDAKQCALIAVEEIIASHRWPRILEYWQEVKVEIEKL